jgi:hypothetical protein
MMHDTTTSGGGLVMGVYREVGSLQRPTVRYVPVGASLADLARSMDCLPADFDQRGMICINGHVAPRALWHSIRPKAAANGVQVEVTFHAVPMGGGGGGDGKKNIFALVAAFALTALTGFVTGGGLARVFGLGAFTAGSVPALLAAGGIGLVGSLLLSSLVPPPTIDTGKSFQNPGAASADGNILEPNGPVPRVLGQRKVYPPLACEPFTYFDGPDEVVEAIYILSGPHELTDIRVGAAAIAGLTNVEFETRPGFPGDPRISLVERQARTEAPQAELRGHAVASGDGRTLESPTGAFSDALPQPLVLATRAAPDEQWLHLIWSGGLNKNASDTDVIRVPLRLRIRPVGAGTWTNLPEIHFAAANVRQMRCTIKLVWADDASTSPGAANGEGFIEARIAAPEQTQAPTVPAWAADAYFDDGVGDDYMTQANLGSTRVDHVVLDRFTAAFYLATATFPRGRYEIEVLRGAPVRNADWSSAAYTVSSVVWDLFGFAGSPGIIPQSRNGISDSVVLLRSVSIWNEHPLPTDRFASVVVRARNRQLDKVSCIAGGWVRDWDGTGWRTWAITSNPAPHYRDVLTGAQNLDPVPEAVIDDAGLVAWRTACDALNYRVNALIESGSVDDAARIVASCGYAKPYMSEIWGVVRDFDRSSDAPVQVFTSRNAAEFQFTKAFARVPEGFRVNFRDADSDYETRQITVFRPGQSNDTGRLEQVTYEGLVTEPEVVARALYDQAQTDRRSVFYSLKAPAENIVCRRGSLVAVQNEALSQHTGAARIVDLTLDGAGMVTAVRLDSEVPVRNEIDLLSVPDLLAVPDMLALGAKTGVMIRRDGSVTTHAVSNATGDTDTLTFAAPISAVGIGLGALVSVGPLTIEALRLIVFAIEPEPDLTATITFVDEAPGIVPDLAA